MPDIFTPGYEKDGLKPYHSLTRVLHFLKLFASENMNAYLVGDRVNTLGVNELGMINPIGDRLQSEEKPVMRINESNRDYHKKKKPLTVSCGESRMKSLGEG